MINKILFFVALVFIAVSCTEEIVIELDTTYTRLVVDGNIESDTGIYRVTLTKSADYFSNIAVPKVVNANVFLSDGFNIFPLQESEIGSSGIYETHPGFAGEAGKTYTLHIEIPEAIAGKSVFEASSALKPVTRLDSVAAEFRPDMGREGIWTIKLWAQEPGDEVNYYLFNLYRNGVLMTDTITKKVVSDDKFYNGSYMTGVNVIYLNNAHKWETIYPGDVITLQMSGITKEYFNFIDQVKRSGFSIPFFSGPPANVQGNISNGGIGFFSAYSNSFKSAVVK
ncbi:MAG: DUF4249 domain-containing protein [Bacteroidetes bacterium]|nr:DUF4249 domain-containing protein [Bacteroidota bacterium]